MIRSWMILFLLCAVRCPALGQCSLGASPGRVEIVASPIGQKGLGGAVFAMGASCGPGQPSANVKFHLDTSVGATANSGLIVSPSSGTTPLEIHVGVDPNRVGNSFPGSGPRLLYFTTVDQTPPAITLVTVTVTLTTPDPPVIQSVVNAASLAPVVTPGAVVLIRGSSLGPNMSAALDLTGLYRTTLGNTIVTFNGIPAPILSLGPTAIKAVAPYGIGGQAAAQVILTHYAKSSVAQVSEAFSVPVADTSLGIFSRTPSGSGQADIQNCDRNGCTPNSVDNPAPPGSIIVFFATGVAPWVGPGVDGSVAIVPRLYPPPGVGLSIGGQLTQILYAGVAPYQVWGMFQVNARIPENIGSGPQPVVLTVGQASNTSQQATVAVQ